MNPKPIAEKILKKFKTNNPFALADSLNIIILRADLKGVLGYYSRYKRCKFIHLDITIPPHLEKFVCAHELGHALLHPNVSTPFLKRNTLFSTAKIEREAHAFAVELLLPDSLIQEYDNASIYHLGRMVGIPEKLIGLKPH